MADDLHTLLADMVAIPSMNPMGSDAPGEGFGEADMADYVEAFLRRHRIPCERQDALPGRPNVVGRVEGRDAESIVFEAHMDTVLADHMDIEPFQPEVRAGCLYGRGSCDTKASLAAMLDAVRRATDRGSPPRSICVAATADEEYKFTGVVKLIESGLRARMAIVGEPTRLDLVVAHKGCLRWEVEARGVSAHSSTPDQGDNAIYRMAEIVKALERYAGLLSQEPGHPLAGGKTLSVGIIHGGQTVNTVPDRCHVLVDRRTLPDEDPEEAYQAAAAYLKAEVGGHDRWQMLPPFLCSPGLDVDPESEVVAAAKHACESVGLSGPVRGVAYGTDASKLHKAGIPSVVFGPGDIRQAHSAVEFVALEQVEQARDVFEALMLGS